MITFLAVLSRGIVSMFVAVGSLYGLSIFYSKSQVTYMDDVCKFFDFVVFTCFYFLYSLCVMCVLL